MCTHPVDKLILDGVYDPDIRGHEPRYICGECGEDVTDQPQPVDAKPLTDAEIPW